MIDGRNLYEISTIFPNVRNQRGVSETSKNDVSERIYFLAKSKQYPPLEKIPALVDDPTSLEGAVFFRTYPLIFFEKCFYFPQENI